MIKETVTREFFLVFIFFFSVKRPTKMVSSNSGFTAKLNLWPEPLLLKENLKGKSYISQYKYVIM